MVRRGKVRNLRVGTEQMTESPESTIILLSQGWEKRRFVGNIGRDSGSQKNIKYEGRSQYIDENKDTNFDKKCQANMYMKASDLWILPRC